MMEPYCEECDRWFQNVNNLRQHLNSARHKPKTVQCYMYSRGCNQMFVSWSAMVLHLEEGGCRSGITRAEINRFVVERDRQNIITNPNRMITGPSGSSFYEPPPPTIATEQAWNGGAYECYFCHSQFRALTSLNQHLASPRHSVADGSRLYRCPNTRDCGQQFFALSGLVQHIEWANCGVQRFEEVRRIPGLVSGIRMIQY
ncbi:hypothetical protein PUNSTDRAFT_142427 [Punctularia strigosozonata HHB-11173 SS5]|uniref:uncharacterized protein n=1 Tax=Punctularia strigosozonata (strain HHB-11173) TaxID=741275 RepID=UPI0004417E13|nr:uncharacterized protein PUNSTDRAFT_142427 [Punctularia strigosozonata HHB-11173 SS5]EIN10396.1 hypothetical protein PUNSTDRAFT_142427 [Punctularia strigosozonata HHB-11173 SS5]